MTNPHPHPACVDVEALLHDCEFQRTRRSGPGGQHRNKVESAIVITHQPTGIIGQASERRSQHENRREAILRLRLNLALGLRSKHVVSGSFEPSELWCKRVQSRQINISASHDEFPAMLAEALDVIHAGDYDAGAAAEALNCSISQLIKLLKKEPAALEMVNRQRAGRGQKKYR